MSLEQVGLQLGLAGFIVLVVYRVAIVFIARWGIVEDARTATLDAGLTSIASKVERHALADIESHQELGERVARIEGKLDAVRIRARTSPHGLPYPNGEDE